MCERMTAQEVQDCNGGQGCCVYKIIDTIPSFDKGGHKMRSLYNQPNHAKHRETKIQNCRQTSGSHDVTSVAGNFDNFDSV